MIDLKKIINQIDENINKLTYGRVNGIIPETTSGLIAEQYILARDELNAIVNEIRERDDLDLYYVYASDENSISIAVTTVNNRPCLTYYSHSVDDVPVKSFAAPEDYELDSAMAIFTLLFFYAYAKEIKYQALEDKIIHLKPEEILLLSLHYSIGDTFLV